MELSDPDQLGRLWTMVMAIQTTNGVSTASDGSDHAVPTEAREIHRPMMRASVASGKG